MLTSPPDTDEVCMPLRGDKAHTVVNEYGASPEAMRRTYYFTNHAAWHKLMPQNANVGLEEF